jgi:serine/threonine/tyrosine-interacting protein
VRLNSQVNGRPFIKHAMTVSDYHTPKMKDNDFLPGLPHAVIVPAELAPRTAYYSLAPPSPPAIHIPHAPDSEGIVLPAYEGVGGEDLTQDDLRQITQVSHTAVDQTRNWKYENRREVQLITPFLYLGPSIAAKDIKFIQSEDITMLLVIRDTMSALARMLSGDRVANQLGIASAAVDVSGSQELIAAFPRAIKIINEHLLSIYHQQALTGTGHSDGNIIIDQSTFKRGKVLVFCESGNERSACVVAAYMMAVYGMDLVTAIQFVQSQRFCIALDDQMKGLLRSFQDILEAQRFVQKAKATGLAPVSAVPDAGLFNPGRCKSKRHIGDTMGDDMEVDVSGEMDDGRFEGRTSFRPFMDRDEN